MDTLESFGVTYVYVPAFNELVDEGYLTRRVHPKDPDLFIWNYTPKCQFERYWTLETMMCRGLITRGDGEIVARPFRKFFNALGEHEAVFDHALPWDLDFQVTEKADGSLAILYWHDGKPYCATRGSFESDQAKVATRILHERYLDYPFNPRYTYLFEVIFPAGRIVVDYHGMEDLILLAVIETSTGNEQSLALYHDAPFPVVRRYSFDNLPAIQDYMERHALDGDEGFVLRFDDGTRAKIKHVEYLRLHRLITNVNTRNIWEMMRYNQDVKELVERVPDEFFNWLMQTIGKLTGQFHEIERQCRWDCASVMHLADRKEIAERVKQNKYPAIVFKMLDGKDYRDAIWKLLKPAAEKPFRTEDPN